MWVSSKLTSLPRTKAYFYITSTKGEKFCVKPGKAYVLKNGGWSVVRATGLMNNKIDRVIISPNGYTSIHLPKMTGLLAVHQNHGQALVLTLPLPKVTNLSNGAPSALECIAPSGEGMIMTTPHHRVTDMPFLFKVANRISSDFPSHVRGLSTSEDGQAMAMAVDNQLWIWQQYPEEVKGIGFWTDLTANQRFNIAVESNHPMTQNGRVYHGYMRPMQYFTLNPVLAPNVPQNSAISYQDLAMFNNPDEGRGICCLTSLLPPCKPFDTLYLFNSICVFKGLKPTFQRADVTLPVIEGGGGPCIWWSLDCRLAVIAVSKSLVIVTRYLRVIAVIPLVDLFPEKESIVASVAWSCHGQFFIITSTTGYISGATRSGKSMRHVLCHLTPFDGRRDPLMVCGDSRDPALFVVYSRERFRELRIDLSKIPQTLENLMSLHFPQKTVENMWKPTIDAIRKNGYTPVINLIRLLYLTDLFRIWPYYSPLRHLLWTMFNDGINYLLDNHEDLLAVLLIRCVFRLTEKPVDAYEPVLYRLGLSTNKRDLLLKKIMTDELEKKDYVASKSPEANTRIFFYEPTKEDEETRMELKQPHHGRNVDLYALIKEVRGILYDPDYDFQDMVPGVDVRLLLELMTEAGQFEKALALARHPSVACDPTQLFIRIATLHPNEPGLLFSAMQMCIRASPDDEIELRAACVAALVNILKQRIADSMPKASDLRMKFLSSLISVEETLELIVPENREQLNDFAVILGIAFAAADYPNCASYFNGRINMIRDPLRMHLRELFGLVWFVRWRFAAICDSARTGHANDATLRLLAFPEFVNRKAALAQIYAAGEATFSPDAYALYVGGRGIMEKDPAFVDFAVQCSNRITPRGLTRIASAVLNMNNEQQSFPKSGILLAFIISHMVPWLRCAIPRALVGFECNESVPRELLDFEDWQLPKYRPPKMEIHTVVATPVESDSEEEPLPPPPPPPEPAPPEDESEGEFIPEPEPEPKPKPKPKVHHRPKKVPKRRKPEKPERPPPERKPRGPPLRLLSLDPNARQTYTQYQYAQPPPPPQYSRPYQQVWDYDPNQWRPHDDRPVQAPVETNRKPLVIFGSVPSKKDDHMESSSSISELELEEPRRGPIPNTNPFPLDDELHRRVEYLLDASKAAPDPQDLPPPPEFVRPAMKAKPPKPKKVVEHHDESIVVATTTSVPKKDPISQWRPPVVSMRDSRLIGVQEIPASQFNQSGALPARTAQLQEIQRPRSDTKSARPMPN